MWLAVTVTEGTLGPHACTEVWRAQGGSLRTKGAGLAASRGRLALGRPGTWGTPRWAHRGRALSGEVVAGHLCLCALKSSWSAAHVAAEGRASTLARRSALREA